MEFFRCGAEHYDPVVHLYRRVVKKLEDTVNYPKWSDEHPSAGYVEESIKNGEQYACAQDGRIVGALVCSENPEGCYELGDWKRNLKRGEYLVIHVLAVDPGYERRGVAGFMVDSCVTMAKENGYKGNRGNFFEIIFSEVTGAEMNENPTAKCTECGDVRLNGEEIQLKLWNATLTTETQVNRFYEKMVKGE